MTSAFFTAGIWASEPRSTPRCSSSSFAVLGGSTPTFAGTSVASSFSAIRPRAVSTTDTVWPRLRSAAMTCTALARATSRSAEVPPVRTVTRIGER